MHIAHDCRLFSNFVAYPQYLNFKAPAHSPVKGVMAALSKHRVSQEPLSSLHKPVKKIEGMDIPEKIEDVPFRRQDRRILNARKKRIIAKRIICFGITTCMTFLGLGIALIVIYCLFQEGKLLKNLLNKNTIIRMFYCVATKA